MVWGGGPLNAPRGGIFDNMTADSFTIENGELNWEDIFLGGTFKTGWLLLDAHENQQQ